MMRVSIPYKGFNRRKRALIVMQSRIEYQSPIRGSIANFWSFKSSKDLVSIPYKGFNRIQENPNRNHYSIVSIPYKGFNRVKLHTVYLCSNLYQSPIRGSIDLVFAILMASSENPSLEGACINPL